MTKQEKINAPDLAGALERAAKERRIEIDVEKYQAYLDDPSLSDEQRAEIIQALWTIITAFVELGFGVHPVQQACGQLENALDPSKGADSDVIECEDTDLREEFNTGPDRA